MLTFSVKATSKLENHFTNIIPSSFKISYVKENITKEELTYFRNVGHAQYSKIY